MNVCACRRGASHASESGRSFDQIRPARLAAASVLLERKYGSAHQLVEVHILGRFLKNDEFGLSNSQTLGLEQ